MTPTELRRLTASFGSGPACVPKAPRFLPMVRCEQCHTAVVAARWQASIAPPPRRPCVQCGRPIPRNAYEGRCEGCRAIQRGTQQRELSLPWRHERARFGSPELARWCADRDAIERAQAFAENPPEGCRVLLFTGPTEAGKSSLVSAVVQHLTATGRCRRLVWTDAKRLAQARMEHALGSGEPPAITRALAADVAVLDDLGKELVFPAAMAAEVVTFLERRHAGERPRVPAGALDIITTELPVVLDAEEAAERETAGEPLRDLTRLYDLSFVRRVAGALRNGVEIVRGSAVVIKVRAKGPEKR